MGTSSLELKRRLADLAASQGGYFTASQAVRIGYQDATHPYHVRYGHWERVGWGIYRLKEHQQDAWSELHRILLWSRDKTGICRGVFHGRTALAIITRDPDLLDSRNIELCVPKSFRRSAPKPNNVILIFKDLCSAEITYECGLPVLRNPAYTNTNICSLDAGGFRGPSFIDMIARGED